MKEALEQVLFFCQSKKLKPIYAKVISVKNKASLNILNYFGFKAIAPMFEANPEFLSSTDIEEIINEKKYGMLFQWI